MTYENNIIKSKLNKYMTVQTYTNVTLNTKKKFTFTNKQKNIYKHMTKIYIYYKQVDF
jgi:hypothetical protein